MNHYHAEKIIDESGATYFFIVHSESMLIIKEPTKYLKHKMRENCSPNTVKKLAFSISYYHSFLDECGLSVETVLNMKYADQYAHFVKFLYWIQAGKHCERNKLPNNATCNSYLQAVFGYYEFLLLEYENTGTIKVLESRTISYNGTAGVRFHRGIYTFRGYLPENTSVGRTIEEGKIKTLLEASTNVRNTLLILLLAETGFRIGELLGIRYAKDIDFDNHTIKVTYREDNKNEARAKNAEIRRAKISDETFELLLYYISENRRLLQKTEYLFINLSGITEGEAMTVNAVYSVLRVLERRTGIKVTPHMLRHYFANARRKTGWSMELISKALGHKQIRTTEKYMNIEDEEMVEAMEQYYEKHAGLYDIEKII